tara:strand:- start:1154 stop:1429 length:276 start_codon:yes stop_codon:yes gene_type:complete
MRRFKVKREEDESGVSGTGIVAEGVEFDDGTVAMKWLSHKSTVTFFANIKHLKDLHGHGGKTKVVWVDPDPLAHAEEEEEVDKTDDESTQA